MPNALDNIITGAIADPAFSVQVSVGERGRSLEWPGEIDLCADALCFGTHWNDATAASVYSGSRSTTPTVCPANTAHMLQPTNP
jgi:hypothetical protein